MSTNKNKFPNFFLTSIIFIIIWDEKKYIKLKKKNVKQIVKNICVFTGVILKKYENKNLKNIMKISGIYKIVNKINGKYYIGSSINIHRRWREHKCGLLNNKHPNLHLQKSWNKYGCNNFDFIIISIFPTENVELILKEEEKLLSVHTWSFKSAI
jgi:hypothetical protein